MAHLRGFTGSVTVKAAEQSAEEAARADHPLHVGDVVTTAAASTADIELAGGNRVVLQPETSLVIREGGGTAAKVGAVLLAGGATVSSGGRGVLLAIGTPFGLTEIGAGEGTAEVSLEKGVRVLVGEVVVVEPGGERTTVAAGSAFTIDGLVVKIDEPEPEAHLTLAPLEVVLLANPKQVQVMKAGESTWRAPRKREVLGTGDAVRTRKAHGTRMQVSDKGSLTLNPRTELVFQGASSSEQERRARYELKLGNVLVHLERDGGSASEHEIMAGGLGVAVAPGAQQASVEVSAGENGRAQVVVRLGRVRLSDGTEVAAGSAATIQDGKLVGEVRPLAATHVEVKARTTTVVSYAGDVPAVELTWPREEGVERYELELGQDKELATPSLREEVAGNRFVHDRLQPGRYYWRVKGKGDWARGVFTVQRARDSDCANCKRRNVIDDNGEATVVYYQRRLPAITLRWGAVAGAARYRVRVYPDGEFDTPLVDETVAETTVPFDEGRFEEGKFYWHVVAADAGGKEVATGRMNTLQIAYDNAVTDLLVKGPGHGDRVKDASVVTSGEVQLGARLYINGKRANLDDKGRFRQSLPLERGANTIVYQTITSEGVERYYVRQVYRR